MQLASRKHLHQDPRRKLEIIYKARTKELPSCLLGKIPSGQNHEALMVRPTQTILKIIPRLLQVVSADISSSIVMANLSKYTESLWD